LSRRGAVFGLLAVAVIAFVLSGSEPLLAQCSMCRAALEQNVEVAQSFNRAILFLLVFPYLLFGSITAWYLHSRFRRNETPSSESPSLNVSAAAAD